MSIQGYAEAIKDGVVEENEMEESLDVIIDESKRLKKIVDEMIYLIKLDNVEETFDFEITSIQEVINQAMKSVKALADAKEVSVKVEGELLYKGNFDKEKLSRAFINILGNGVRYADREIVISSNAYNNYIEIIIKDDGKGLQIGEESKVFERFYKGEKGGTGIGLAITKAIVTGHNGHIEAYNAVPKGAAFKVLLPRSFKQNI
jgi:signal transduction histidine kinase